MKKKILVTALFLFAAVAMAFGLLACNTKTSEYNDSGNITGTDGSDTDGPEGGGRGDYDELYYSLNDDKVSYSVTGYSENFGGDVEIPEMYKSFPVTSIAASAFYNCTTLTSVVLSNNITSVDVSAFNGCTSLVNVTIGEKVTYIGSSAFSGCSSLESLTLPFAGESGAASTASASTLFGYIFGTSFYNGGSAVQQFYSDTLYEIYYIPASLTSVTITSTDVLPGAFNNCDKIPSIILGDGVTSVGDYAFYGCAALTDVSISDSVVSIGDAAFGYCTSLVTISIPESVWSLGKGIFRYCASLKHVEFLDEGSYVSEGMFYCCDSLEDLSLPGGVTEIGSYAYYGCTGLYSITVSGNAVVIGPYAFSDCTSLAAVVLDGSVSEIGEYAFYNCLSLASVTIRDGVDSIGSHAFCDCVSVTSITVPSSVTTIGDSAFSGCSSLESMTLPFVGGHANTSASASKLFGYIFGTVYYEGGASTTQYYTSTKPVTYFIPAGLTSVEVAGGGIVYGSFYNCSYLTSVTIGEQVGCIDYYAFYGCTGLTEINFNALAVDICGDFAFSCAGKDTTGVTVTIGVNVTKIPLYFLSSQINGSSDYSNNIKSVVFESGSKCKEIGDYAFYGCTSLSSIIIPDSVLSIGSSSFLGCTSLTSFTIGTGVTQMGNYMFYECTNLTEINFNAVAMNDLFEGNNVFCNAGGAGSGITVTIGAGVTQIPAYLFGPSSHSSWGAPKITAVIFEVGSQCTSIGNYAFCNCTSLTSVYFSGNVSEWSEISIGDCSFTDGATIYYYSETGPDYDDECNYWHYDVNGEIAVWVKEEN